MDSALPKRQVARKVWIRDLLAGTYVKEEGFKPNHVLLPDGRHVARANIMGVVVGVGQGAGQEFLVDDGTGSVLVRSFEPDARIATLQPGQAVIVVGRPRAFGNERYVLLEVVRVVDDLGWLAVRKAELGAIPAPRVREDGEALAGDGLGARVMAVVRELDAGQGVLIEDVLARVPGSENAITHLLLNGDVFELSPGKIKVLE